MKVSVILMFLLSLISGCASYSPGVFPVGNLSNDVNVAVNDGVRVFVNTPDYSAQDTFVCDLETAGILPIYISITNSGKNHYSFSKRDINYQYLPAKQVAEECSKNPNFYFALLLPVMSPYS